MRLQCRIHHAVILILSLLTVNCLQASNHVLTDIEVQNHAANPQWLAMLQFFDTGTDFGKSQSQMKNPAFFIAQNGNTNLEAEFRAEFALFSDPHHQDFNRFACQFPARFHWMKKQFPEIVTAKPDCPEFEEFKKEINIESVYLVFPVAYLNSPSSMFGHTLLRIKSKHRQNPLLDYAVNFAADADAKENNLSYSYKGLTGGYPGTFSVVHYYVKIKEYSFLDSRDIWEYQLKLTSDEQDQLVRHIWELKSFKFDYYFLTQNCSYRLMTLLAAVSDRLQLGTQFLFRTIPADTIRYLDTTIGFSDIYYRPSQVTQLRYQESQMSKADVKHLQEIILNPDEDASTLLNFNNKVEALNLAFDYSRYVAAKEKRRLPHMSQRSMQVLSLRSRQGIKPQIPVPRPKIRDDQGHKTLAITPAFAHGDKGNIMDLGIRGAYHDNLDNPLGYPKGAQLELFNLTLRHRFDDEKTFLQELAFVNIHSQTPVTTLVKPKSWKFGFGLRRQSLEDRLGGYIEGGAGRTWNLNALNLSLMMTGSMIGFDGTGFIDYGPEMELSYQQQNWSGYIRSSIRDNLNRKMDLLYVHEIGIAKHFNSWQLRLRGVFESTDEQHTSEVGLGVRFYHE